MHNLTDGQGYQDIELDFTGCTAAYGGPILAIAGQTKRYQIGGVDVDLILPKDEQLSRLFLNANWANLLIRADTGRATIVATHKFPRCNITRRKTNTKR
jgi:hypothetical protein